MMYFTYVLRSMKDVDFDIGFTSDLKLRFEPYNDGVADSTKHKRPFNLIKRIPRCSASGLIKIPFDTSQLCCGVVHSIYYEL